MSDGNTVTISIIGGPTFTVPWTQGMNAQQAIEAACDASSPGQFTYAIQYYGSTMGYLVIMINDTYESARSSGGPSYYWEFLVNGIYSTTGIDNTILNAGDTITFEFQMYSLEAIGQAASKVKHEARSGATKSQ